MNKKNILKKGFTEPAFSGRYLNYKERGMYKCAGCGQVLFSSDTKFDSGTGWPSFTNPVNLKYVKLKKDFKLVIPRTEVVCSKCGRHLGHVFNDWPNGSKRYCINSGALGFEGEI